jgi:hypothetical protein
MSGGGEPPSIGGGSAGGGSSGGSVSGGGLAVDYDQPLIPGSPGTADVLFEIRTDRPRFEISPLIYGTNQPTNPTRNRYGVLRLGGNRLSAFNWETNASNAGNDYLFQNDGYLSQSNTAGAVVSERLLAAGAISSAVLLTIPMLDVVAADKNGGGDVRNSPNYMMTRFRQNKSTKPSALSLMPDPNDGFVYQDEFVNWVRQNAGSTPVLFALDNEPDLWSLTHAAIHPDPVTYAELISKTLDYAKAVKRVWPQAPVTGFVSYGFSGYVNLQDAPDSAGKGEFVDYFLAQMRIAEEKEGKRLVDYLDLHWYPEVRASNVRITGTEATSAVVSARVQAPRSLYDEKYVENSWIVSALGDEPVRLVARMKEKIAKNYPGTKLAFTEWNYGGGDHISGAIAAADVLGSFGREGVGLATYWKMNGNEAFADAAFEAFRNYDGRGGAFGDTSIAATTDQIQMATVYASVDSKNPSRTVLVLINKDTQPRTAGISLAHPLKYQTLAPYVIEGAQPRLSAKPALSAVATNAFRYQRPALSISVLELRP